MRKNLILLLMFSIFIGCSPSEDGPTDENGNPITPDVEVEEVFVEFLPNKLFEVTANSSEFTIESPVIYDTQERIIPDGTSFKITVESENTFVSQNEPENFSNEIDVLSSGGKILFKARAPSDLGTYRIGVRTDISSSKGRYTIQVFPESDINSIGNISINSFLDLNDNNIKDDFEVFSIPADGQSTTQLVVGPVLDNFGNNIQTGQIKLDLDKGIVVSGNPAPILDGFSFFTIQSNDSIPGIGNIEINAVYTDGSEVPSTELLEQITYAAPNIQIEGTSNFGALTVGSSETITLTLRNNGNGTVSNFNLNITSPFFISNQDSCALKDNTLVPGGACNIQISVDTSNTGLIEGSLSVNGSPGNLEGSSDTATLSVSIINPPQMIIETPFLDYGVLKCGSYERKEIIIENTGDLPAQGFQITTPGNNTGATRPYFQVIAPPDDPIADENGIFTCGNSLPQRKKCRFFIDYSPETLYSEEPIVIQAIIDGQSPINITLNSGVIPGDPISGFLIETRDPISNSLATRLDLDPSDSVNVRVGPIIDSCGNSISDGTPLTGSVTAGNLQNSTVFASSGFADFSWSGSNDVNDAGQQTFSIEINNIPNSTNILFSGINLDLTGNPDLGNILNSEPQDYSFVLTNSGSIAATNIQVSVVNTGITVNPFEIKSLGECTNGILGTGQSCTFVIEVDTSLISSDNTQITGDISIIANEVGDNQEILNIFGISLLPPQIEFAETNLVIDSYQAGSSSEFKTVTILNNNSAVATDIAYTVPSPFEIFNSNCLTTIDSNSSCSFDVRLNTNVSGVYSEQLEVSSFYNTVTTLISGEIIPGNSDGEIIISKSKDSLFVDNIDTINLTFGPITDEFGNVVSENTEIKLETPRGVLGSDTDQNGSSSIFTDSNGYAYDSIRSQFENEVGSFQLLAEISSGFTIFSTGSTTINFDGVLLALGLEEIIFNDTQVGSNEIRTINLINNGSIAAENLDINISGDSIDQFSIDNLGTCSGGELLPGNTCTLSIIFEPTTNIEHTSFLNVSTSSVGISDDIATLNGQGTLPANFIVFDTEITAQASFGSSFNGSFNLGNEGNEIISGINFLTDDNNSDFSFSGCPSIASLGNCTVSFVYTPSSNDALTTTIRISGTADSGSKSASIPFSSETSELIFSIIDNNIPRNECSEVQIQFQDADDNPQSADGFIPINLTTTSNNIRFYFENSCTTEITGVSILDGESETTSFFMSSSSNGIYTVSGTSTDYSVDETITIFEPIIITPDFNNPIFVEDSTKTFSVAGGSPPYTWNIDFGSLLFLQNTAPNGSSITYMLGGSISEDPGFASGYSFTVTDSLGETTTIIGSYSAQLSLSPEKIFDYSYQTSSFTAAGGSQDYTYSISVDAGIGSVINSSGEYTAGNNTDPDNTVFETILVTDSFGNTASQQIEINNLKRFEQINFTYGDTSNLFSSINVSGEYIVVSGFRRNSQQGQVISYKHDGSILANVEVLEDMNGTDFGSQANEWWGISSDVNDSGEIFVGSPRRTGFNSFGPPFTNEGAVYYLKYNETDLAYEREQIITPQEFSGNIGFGRRVVLGDSLLVTHSDLAPALYQHSDGGFGFYSQNGRYNSTSFAYDRGITISEDETMVFFNDFSGLHSCPIPLTPSGCSSDPLPNGRMNYSDSYTTSSGSKIIVTADLSSVAVSQYTGGPAPDPEIFTISAHSAYSIEDIAISNGTIAIASGRDGILIFTSENGISGWTFDQAITFPAGLTGTNMYIENVAIDGDIIAGFANDSDFNIIKIIKFNKVVEE